MKIIASSGGGKFICEVNKVEIEKFKNLYYGKMGPLSIGDIINLGAGYDFHRETKTALNDTQKFISSNAALVKAMVDGIRILAEPDKTVE